MPFLLGMDIGGSRSVAAVADETGRIVGVGRAGGANYQEVGTKRAAREIRSAMEQALDRTGAISGTVVAAAYGVAGADRDVDFEAVRALLDPLSPVPTYTLVNDTIIALRAGTDDGLGVCCVGGNGANCIGRNRFGITKKVGGLGPISGDSGSAGAIVSAAVTAALWGREGRGPETALYGRLTTELGLQSLDDFVQFGYYDRGHAVDLGRLVLVVFDVAAAGDAVALELLRAQGRGVARAALCAIRALFGKDDEVAVILAGSVLGHQPSGALFEACAAELQAGHGRTRLKRLEVEPAIGALLLARDGQVGAADAAFAARVRSRWPAW